MRLSLEVRRKLMHMTMAVIPLAYIGLPRRTMVMVMAGVLLAEALVEFTRLLIPSVNRFLMDRFTVYRQKEVARLSGVFYAMLAFTVAVTFLEKKVAIPAMFFLTFGDAASAFMRMENGDKTLPKSRISSFACLVVCFGVSVWSLPWVVALGGSVTAAVIERAAGDWVDDNLVIPLGSGLVMTLMMGV